MASVTYAIDVGMGDVVEGTCPVLYSLGLVGQKWKKLPLLWCLHEEEPVRYNELRRRVPGITNTMLSKSLRELEADGLMVRTDQGTTPDRVDYALAPAGRDLLPAFNELHVWGSRMLAARGVRSAPGRG